MENRNNKLENSKNKLEKNTPNYPTIFTFTTGDKKTNENQKINLNLIPDVILLFGNIDKSYAPNHLYLEPSFHFI